jgi:hypothetical protein
VIRREKIVYRLSFEPHQLPVAARFISIRRPSQKGSPKYWIRSKIMGAGFTRFFIIPGTIIS